MTGRPDATDPTGGIAIHCLTGTHHSCPATHPDGHLCSCSCHHEHGWGIARPSRPDHPNASRGPERDEPRLNL